MASEARPRVILLLSDKSSGSTIFQYELLKHAAVRAVEWTMHNDHETLYWVKAACLLGFPDGDYYQGRAPLSKRQARAGIEELLRRNVPDFNLPTDDEALIFTGWEALCRRHGSCFFEKSPHHLNNWAATSLLLRYALSTSHDVRVSGLVRNPMAVIYSTWDRWLSEPTGRQYLWSRTMRNLITAQHLLPPERYHLVRYEDLIAQPVGVMAQVCDFLDLPRDEQVGAGVHAASAMKWVGDERFAFTLDPTVAALAHTFGYSEDELYNPPKPAPSALVVRKERVQHFLQTRKHRLINQYVKPLLRS